MIITIADKCIARRTKKNEHKEICVKYYKQNKDKVAEQQKKDWDNNKEKIADRSNKLSR